MTKFVEVRMLQRVLKLMCENLFSFPVQDNETGQKVTNRKKTVKSTVKIPLSPERLFKGSRLKYGAIIVAKGFLCVLKDLCIFVRFVYLLAVFGSAVSSGSFNTSFLLHVL